jgi:hypothetical protein
LSEFKLHSSVIVRDLILALAHLNAHRLLSHFTTHRSVSTLLLAHLSGKSTLLGVADVLAIVITRSKRHCGRTTR